MLVDLSITDVRERIEHFKVKYIWQWTSWLEINSHGTEAEVALEFASMLRKWQACRPNIMRRTIIENAHPAPFIEDLLHLAKNPLSELIDFDLSSNRQLPEHHANALRNLWDIFYDICYKLPDYASCASIVGVSKATLILTNGLVGPAFDKFVRTNLNTGSIESPERWIEVLELVREDTHQFQLENNCLLIDCVPIEHKEINLGRIYDMIFGPSN